MTTNKTITPATMQAVLLQLPAMSDKIVDDTRHEKVLSYMQLYLESPTAIQDLLKWNLLGTTITQCIQPYSDFRVSSVAVRFLGGCIAVDTHGQQMWHELVKENTIIRWIIDNRNSQHAILRFSCLSFIRQVAMSTSSAELFDYAGYVFDRLVDSSYFVVAEASRLLAVLFPNNSLKKEIERMVAIPYDELTDAQKRAILTAAHTLFGIPSKQVHDYALDIFAVDGMLEPFVFDTDRLVRDKALDVLEKMLAVGTDSSITTAVIGVLVKYVGRDHLTVLVVLRCLAAITKVATGDICHEIAQLAVSVLTQICDIPYNVFTSTSDLNAIKSGITTILGDSATGRSIVNGIALESSRVVREYCCHTFDEHIFSVLEQLLESKKVQRHPQLFHQVLDSIIHLLRQAAATTGSVDSSQYLAVLPGLVSNFAIRAPGLKLLFELAFEIIEDNLPGRLGAFMASLSRATGTRLVDVEWEARDTVLEFVDKVVSCVDWNVAKLLVGQKYGDVVMALKDAEEYVRASAAQTVSTLITRGDQQFVHEFLEHEGLQCQQLAALVNDGEAFVKREALDLICAIGTHTTEDRWIRCLSYNKLYQLSDDPDFEVRVRCAKLLGLLTKCWLEGCGNRAEELQPGCLLVDLCKDPSRYVRKVCLESLLALKESDYGGCGTKHVSTKKRRQATEEPPRSRFHQKLQNIDFARLEASLTAEHLYQEALDTQVERQVMAEESEVNNGNNILDCY